MLSYQTKYIENTKKIAAQSDFYGITASDFPAWFALQKQAAATIEKLRQENIALLSENLFPVLDDLHNADNETIALLEEFAETLLDWRSAVRGRHPQMAEFCFDSLFAYFYDLVTPPALPAAALTRSV